MFPAQGRESDEKKTIMGSWWFELVILGIVLRTQTHSENSKIAKKLQQFLSIFCL